VLLAGPNFGCGSSRETAVWSLMEAGIRCVIAPSFGDIFHDNSFQNGLLPIRLEMAEIERIAAALEGSNTSTVTIDLERCVIEVPGLAPIRFALADDRRLPLLEGLDQLGFMLRSETEIDDFENKDAAARPWAYEGVS
jgi:3-isopropylmalate/(R)-2-methylmalate dehydratase small subunit